MLKPTKILVPTDFSEYSDRALRTGAGHSEAVQGEGLLLHVVHEEIHRTAWILLS